MNTIYLYADDPPEMQKKPLPHKKKGRGKALRFAGRQQAFAAGKEQRGREGENPHIGMRGVQPAAQRRLHRR